MSLDHGLTMYNHHGCRCDVCRQAATEARSRVRLHKRLARIEQLVGEVAEELGLDWWEADLEREALTLKELDRRTKRQTRQGKGRK